MRYLKYSEMIVRQSGNMYEVYTPQGILVLVISLPNDMQFIKDAAVLDVCCKVLAGRWGVIKSDGKKSTVQRKTTISVNYSGLVFVQIDVSTYQIYLPTGILVANILFPPDYQYMKDSLALGYVCRIIALRYGIK